MIFYTKAFIMSNGSIGSTEVQDIRIEDEEVAPIVITGKKDGKKTSRQVNQSFFEEADEYNNDILSSILTHGELDEINVISLFSEDKQQLMYMSHLLVLGMRYASCYMPLED